ncbi:MAG: PilZ domain-containing protein [Desulfobacteraceae bacterium]|nr:PilZ domain-containing protein [Desulfobacteraceae bacterium]
MNARKFSRVNFQVDATVKAAGHQFHGQVENLSMSGMFMICDERLQLGEHVDMSIILSGVVPEINVTISGKVSRIVENGIGFIFEKTDIDSYTHLKNIVSYNFEDADKIMDEIHHAIDEKIAAET